MIDLFLVANTEKKGGEVRQVELASLLKVVDDINYPNYYPDFKEWLIRSDSKDRLHLIAYMFDVPIGFSIVDIRRNKLCTFFVNPNGINLGDLLYYRSMALFNEGDIRATMPLEVEDTLGKYLKLKGWVETERRNNVYRENSTELYYKLFF